MDEVKESYVIGVIYGVLLSIIVFFLNDMLLNKIGIKKGLFEIED